jgi:hypothetical protein
MLLYFMRHERITENSIRGHASVGLLPYLGNGLALGCPTLFENSLDQSKALKMSSPK